MQGSLSTPTTQNQTAPLSITQRGEVLGVCLGFCFAWDMMLSPCALVWRDLAPPRVEAFCWLVVAGKILTTDNLKRFGVGTWKPFQMYLFM